MVRTPGFHPGNRGSIPRGGTLKNNKIQPLNHITKTKIIVIYIKQNSNFPNCV